AVTGERREDRVIDVVENRLDVFHGDQRLGDLDQDLEDTVLVGGVEDGALAAGRGFDAGLDVLLQAEVEVELRDRADAGGGRVLLARRGRRRRDLLVEVQDEGPDRGADAVADLRGGD